MRRRNLFNVVDQAVHRRHPVVLHRLLLHLGVFASVALHFHHQVQRVILAVAIVHADDEVGNVSTDIATYPVGHGEAQALVRHIGEDVGVRFQQAAEFHLPVAVAYRAVHMAAPCVGLPDGLLGRAEVHVCADALGIERGERGEDGLCSIYSAIIHLVNTGSGLYL